MSFDYCFNTHTVYWYYNYIQASFLQILKDILDNPIPELPYPPLIMFDIEPLQSISKDQRKTRVQIDVLGLSEKNQYTFSVDKMNPGETVSL